MMSPRFQVLRLASLNSHKEDCSFKRLHSLTWFQKCVVSGAPAQRCHVKERSNRNKSVTSWCEKLRRPNGAQVSFQVPLQGLLLSIRWQCHIIILGSLLSEIIVPRAMEALKWKPIYHTFKSRWSCQARLQHWDPFSVSCVVSADVCLHPSARIMQWLPQAAPVHSS